jgi:hypothetical protein
MWAIAATAASAIVRRHHRRPLAQRRFGPEAS